MPQIAQTYNSNDRPVLHAEFLTAGDGLEIKASLRNESNTDFYIFNHLWSGESGTRSPDPQKAYRFFHHGTLRLLYGAAPLPRLKTVTYRNIPNASLLRQGTLLEWTIKLPNPVKEYNIYYAEEQAAVYDLSAANAVEIVVQFVEAETKVKVIPVPNEENTFRIISPGVLDLAGTLTFKTMVPEFKVQKREDEFSRLVLQGEQPEPLKLPFN